MSGMSVGEMSRIGCFVGGGIAVVPATVTFLIASSRAILIELIANVVLRVLTAGHVGITFYGLKLIEVPFLWKVSRLSAIAGGSIFALSFVVFLANAAYLRIFTNRRN